VKQRGVIQTRAQSVKALGEIIQRVDDDRHLRPCERLANNPGLLPATDNRLQIIFGGKCEYRVRYRSHDEPEK
jgi:hypothetical protein